MKLSEERPHANVIDAAAAGASDGMKLAINVAAMLIAFIAGIALINYLLGLAGPVIGMPQLSLEWLFAKLFSPVAFLMGVSPEDTSRVGELLGKKLVLNEFVAFKDLTDTNAVKVDGKFVEVTGMQERSYKLAVYALTGFANFSSIGIQLGGIGAIAPSRRSDLARLGMRARWAGSWRPSSMPPSPASSLDDLNRNCVPRNVLGGFRLRASFANRQDVVGFYPTAAESAPHGAGAGEPQGPPRDGPRAQITVVIGALSSPSPSANLAGRARCVREPLERATRRSSRDEEPTLQTSGSTMYPVVLAVGGTSPRSARSTGSGAQTPGGSTLNPMSHPSQPGPHSGPAHHHQTFWLWVMCLTGVDYFSTLGYQPSIAYENAGLLAPLATVVLVLVTLLRRAAGLLATSRAGRTPGRARSACSPGSSPGGPGKILVLVLLGFAATDFVITKTLSAADAAVHLIAEPALAVAAVPTTPRRPARRSTSRRSCWCCSGRRSCAGSGR